MFVTRCPDCKANVKVADPDAVWIRCHACNFKIELREGEENRKRRIKKEAKARVQKKEDPANIWIEHLPILIALPISLFVLLLTCCLPFAGSVSVAILVALAIDTVGFVKGCMLAAKEGSHVSIDYLEGLGGIRWVIVILFLGFYIQGYFLLWQIAQIMCAIQKPKVFLPWLGMQIYSWFMIFAAVVLAFIGRTVWDTIF
jgi:hypothetical protein